MIYIDQLLRRVEIKESPKRIVSLVPSLTELLYDLELEDEVVGITKFCIHPAHWKKSKSIIGGTKKINLEKVVGLNPDFIIANKEENTKEDIDYLQKKYPVWVSDISTIAQALEMISSVSEITGKNYKGQMIIQSIKAGLDEFSLSKEQRKRICYLIWKDPYFTIGNDTFINSILNLTGFENAISDKSRYPEISLEEIQELAPDYVFLSSEPYPFKDADLELFSPLKAIKVDGQAFSWYGSHLIKSFPYLRTLNSLII